MGGRTFVEKGWVWREDGLRPCPVHELLRTSDPRGPGPETFWVEGTGRFGSPPNSVPVKEKQREGLRKNQDPTSPEPGLREDVHWFGDRRRVETQIQEATKGSLLVESYCFTGPSILVGPSPST